MSEGKSPHSFPQLFKYFFFVFREAPVIHTIRMPCHRHKLSFDHSLLIFTLVVCFKPFFIFRLFKHIISNEPIWYVFKHIIIFLNCCVTHLLGYEMLWYKSKQTSFSSNSIITHLLCFWTALIHSETNQARFLTNKFAHISCFEPLWYMRKQASISSNSITTHLSCFEAFWYKSKRPSIFFNSLLTHLLGYEMLWYIVKQPSIFFNSLFTHLSGLELIRHILKQTSISSNNMLTYILYNNTEVVHLCWKEVQHPTRSWVRKKSPHLYLLPQLFQCLTSHPQWSTTHRHHLDAMLSVKSSFFDHSLLIFTLVVCFKSSFRLDNF